MSTSLELHFIRSMRREALQISNYSQDLETERNNSFSYNAQTRVLNVSEELS